MPAKILVALDGSKTSESILPYVESLLRFHDADLTLATVNPPGKAVEQMAAKGYLDGVAERLRRRGAVVDVDTLWGRAAEALTAYAAAGGFELLALCSRGKSGLKRMLLGSTAEEILRRTKTPVLVVPPSATREAPAALRKIILPLDGSHRSASILKPATLLAGAFGAKLCFVTVVSPSQREEIPVETAAHNLFSDQKRLQKQGFEVDLAVLYGNPVERILAFAEENDADLIGLATHGRTGLDKIFYGNVAESLLRKSGRALLVVRTVAVSRTRAKSPRAMKSRGRALRTLAMVGEVKKGPYNK